MKILSRFLFLCVLLSCMSATAYGEIKLPSGFTLKPFAKVPDARSLAPAPELGVIFVGTRGNALYAIIDQNKDGQAENVRRLTRQLNVPNGISWKDGYLYVAEQHRLVRYPIGSALPDKWPRAEILYDGLPNRRWHGWRYSAFGPDGALYVSIGAPCNVCNLNGLEGTITRFSAPDWRPSIYAHGIRNSVGLLFDPKDGKLWFTDNGADNMGDDLPPDELNRADRADLHFGYPFFGGGTARTTDFTNHTVPNNAQNPEYEFQAHVAPLGLHIYQGDRFPQRYQNGIFVAQHGSWNRSSPVGYQISFLPFDEQRNIKREESFITWWLDRDGDITARPVDLCEWANGRMLISDDAGDQVYILDYQ